MNEPILYLIMRNDIPSLNPGKLAAQAAHCANAAVAAARRSRSSSLKKLLRDWERQSKQDFGTTIVLGAPRQYIEMMQPACQVFDDTYPCEIPREVAETILLGNPYSDDGIWSVHVTPRRSLFLRRELVGAFAFATTMPECLKNLELYP